MLIIAALMAALFLLAHGISDYWSRMHSAPEKIVEESRSVPIQRGHRFTWNEIRCLALNVYHEARGEPLEGRVAVTHVVLNRMFSPKFPSKPCRVIEQGGERRRYRCQFSWWCDGRSDKPHDLKAWRESLQVVKMILKDPTGEYADPTGGALWYHAETVRPYWADVLKPQIKIGKHIFYIHPNKEGVEVAKN